MPQCRQSLAVLRKRYGHLIVQAATPRCITKSHHGYYECLCDCGTRTTVRSDLLRSGKTTSCGCAKRALRGHSIAEIRDKSRPRGVFPPPPML